MYGEGGDRPAHSSVSSYSTYPPSIQSELFYTDLENRSAQDLCFIPAPAPAPKRLLDISIASTTSRR